MHTVEFFFDCSSPWTYLAFESFQSIARRSDVSVSWRPILVGGIFNAVNPSVYENRANPVPAKARYYAKDLQDWAGYVGVTIGQPPVFPVNSVKVMRGALVAMEANRLVPFARRAFERYWSELADISTDDEVRGIAEAAGLDGARLLERIAAPEIKNALRHNTEKCMQRGGFGSPTLFLDEDEMFFGNDRLVLLEHRLGRPE